MIHFAQPRSNTASSRLSTPGACFSTAKVANGSSDQGVNQAEIIN